MVSYEVIGKHIHEARIRVGLTQAEAADRAGISAAYYSKIERGAIRPNIDRLAEISQALCVPFESLFTGSFIPDGEIMDNTPVSNEVFEEYIHTIGKKADPRIKQIMMHICGELLNVPLKEDETL